MRKRSKKRIPQDIKPWIRVRNISEEILQIPTKKTTRWVAGRRRDRNVRMLNSASALQIRQLLLKSLIESEITSGEANTQISQQKLRQQVSSTARHLSRYKNYCAVSGRGRTYNRFLSMARHGVRKLVAVGAISGLIK